MKRASVKELDEILGKEIPVLDHGFIRVVDYMGDDHAIVQAARVSYGKGTKTINHDSGLIKYLMRHYHTTPFEMCDIKLHVKVPIFIARQWLRHRTASVNEYSARYSLLDNEFYIPEQDKLGVQSTTNKQGREKGEIDLEQIIEEIRQSSEISYSCYEKLLDKGLARELARMCINLNVYTQFYWKINLHNLLHFIHLRADSHAQYEIVEYANVIADIVKKWTPITYNAFIEYRQEAGHFSKSALKLLNRMINGEQVSQKDSGLSKREWDEVMSKLN